MKRPDLIKLSLMLFLFALAAGIKAYEMPPSLQVDYGVLVQCSYDQPPPFSTACQYEWTPSPYGHGQDSNIDAFCPANLKSIHFKVLGTDVGEGYFSYTLYVASHPCPVWGCDEPPSNDAYRLAAQIKKLCTQE